MLLLKTGLRSFRNICSRRNQFLQQNRMVSLHCVYLTNKGVIHTFDVHFRGAIQIFFTSAPSDLNISFSTDKSGRYVIMVR